MVCFKLGHFRKILIGSFVCMFVMNAFKRHTFKDIGKAEKAEREGKQTPQLILQECSMSCDKGPRCVISLRRRVDASSYCEM